MKSAKNPRPPGVRVHVDARNEKMNAKIREHAKQRVPFQLVLGEMGIPRSQRPRPRGQDKAEGSVSVEAFVERVKKLLETKARIYSNGQCYFAAASRLMDWVVIPFARR